MRSDLPLLTDEQLERSGVVANCRMNRERSLTGSNGYARELGFEPLAFLHDVINSGGPARWLDLCCGSGTALIEAAKAARQAGWSDRLEIAGVDLVGMFADAGEKLASLQLVEATLSDWRPDRPFDLITCVHGLHYLGDKLGLIARAATWLTNRGRFTANLGAENFRFADHRPAGRAVIAELRHNGFAYNTRQKRLSCDGKKSTSLPFRYLGAHDGPGPNYTGQAVVDSYYERLT